MAFHAALRSAHMGFVSRLEAQARTLLRHHLDTATSEFALSLLMSTVSLEPAAAYQQQAAVMPPPGGRRAAAAADEGENVPPQDDACDEGQVREQRCSRSVMSWPAIGNPYRDVLKGPRVIFLGLWLASAAPCLHAQRP